MKVKFLLLLGLFTVITITCQKGEKIDPIADYVMFGKLKDVFPLKDSITVDLKVGDSISIATNKEAVWVKADYIFVRCYRGIKDIGCPDFGIGTVLKVRVGSEMYKITFNGLDEYTSVSASDQYRLFECGQFKPADYNYGVLRTVGMMNVQFRNIYPNPSNEVERKFLSDTNGFHTRVTFQKRCF